MRGISKLVVAILAIAAMSMTATGAADASTAKKAKLKVATSQKRMLGSGGILVKVKHLTEGKVKLKAKSSTFDQQELRRLAEPVRVEAHSKTARVLLPLTLRGEIQVSSCQPRKIIVSGKGAGKEKVDLKRNTRECKPKPIDLSRADDCDFIGAQQGSLCMLPFPDDYYTVKDRSTPTDRRIDFTDGGMPKNAGGTPIAAAPYNLNDGFSPGQVITVRVPGLDNPEAFAHTNPIPLNDLSRNESKNSDEPIVVIDAETSKRVPIWVELDSNASTPETTAVLIHPAVQFESGHRYIVAMRDLRDADGVAGARLDAPEGFRYYRDDLPSNADAIDAQRKRFENVFRGLRKADIKRANLYLAWDFTVSSDENIAQRLLHIRDDAFAQLGDTDLADGVVQGNAPAFSLSGPPTEFPPCGMDGCQDGENDRIQRRVDGTFTVPCYLTHGCEAPAVFDLDANGNPIQHGTYEANFSCIIPRAAIDTPGAAAGSRAALYGHGLLGEADEVASGPQQSLAQTHKFAFCATDEIGFASEDVPNTIGILQDMGKFPQLTDRVQQGLLNELYLGRLMINPNGFLSNPAFHVDGATLASPGVLDPSKLYYNGNSQGGILGGALTAVAPDFTRASLGVPAMGYSTLLTRSIDFKAYSQILYPAYKDELVHPLLLSMIQMLWDRSEPNGYAHRMTDVPLPNTPPHEVLMNVALGDHQVTNWQADVEARTIGASIHTPIVYENRWPGVDVGWGIDPIPSYPFAGSAIVYWDGGPVRAGIGGADNGVIGTDVPPLANIPNESGDDPHGLPRRQPEEQQMVSDFLRPDAQSAITDTCGGNPCYDGGFTGP